MEIEILIPLVAILSIFVILPGMCFHYFTKWRTQKGLTADDERMLEDLWRSARNMERRIETIERLLDVSDGRDPRPSRDPSAFSRREDEF